MKIITVVGARPQFIKASAISRCVRNDFSQEMTEIMIHTGQHFDANMSDIFFEDLEIPKPKYHLNIAGGNHGAMTGRMMEGIEEVVVTEKPDVVLVYGDTNSTLAAALVASKLHIPIAHVEAGLRSFNRHMPEEVNRVMTDHVSTYLFCPTTLSVENLKLEGITKGVHQVGDVMYDVAIYFANKAKLHSSILEKLNLSEKNYVLVTCHRAENTDDKIRLENILKALAEIAKDIEVIFPIHPRTLKYITKYNLASYLQSICVVEPLSYLDLVALQQSSKLIFTDSGGVQKEAFFYQVPCITMRDETEWVETVEFGWNTLVGADTDKMIQAVTSSSHGAQSIYPYGNGNASSIILNYLRA
jgi:UDP-GlcNAc3NAcA epimerase